MATKVITIDELKDFKNYVLGYGHFTTIHPGHIRYLKHAKSLGSKLVIAIKADKKFGETEPRFPFNQKERAEALSMLDIADALILLKNDELVDLILKTEPKVLVLGKQFEKVEEKEVSEAKKILVKRNISILFHGGDISYSSSELLTSSENEIKNKRTEEFKAACKRQLINKQDLIKSIRSWNKTNLIVLGDVIVDRYIACEALGMSAEAPVVVVKELENRQFCGGAAIVAAHIKKLGAGCKLISVVGDDKSGEFLRKSIKKNQIKDGLIIDYSRPTTFKKRYLVENQKLLRVSRLEQSDISKNIESLIIKELESSAKNADGIVVCDFVYGVITKNIVKKIHELAKKYNLQLFGDLQCSSQIGSILKFKNFNLLCPNEREARISFYEKDLDLETLSNQIIEKTKSKNLIMKLNSDGFIVYKFNNKGNIESQAFPALSVNPLDVTGAGDSLLAVMSTSLASKNSIMLSAALGCCMAAISVETLGNTPINSNSLENYVEEIF